MMHSLVAFVLSQTLPADPTVDLMGFLGQVLAAVKERNWLLVCPFLLIGLVAVARKYGARVWPFLATSRGGALLALVAAFGAAVAAAAVAPGSHAVGVVLLAALGILLANQSLFTWLKKLLFPDGAALSEEVAAKASAAGATVAAGAVAGAVAAADALNKVGK